MIKIYEILSYLFVPLILVKIYLRIKSNKEDRKRYVERFGKNYNNLKSSKKIIWIHAASIGEFKSSDIIIKKYYKKFHILVTTTTKTSAEYINEFYADKVTHQYIPFDIPFWCSRFIDFWNPRLILWIESDIWPNMLKKIRDRKIICFYINARISPKSFNRWKYLKSLYSESLITFNKIFAQSQNDLKRISILSKQNIYYIGNLKLSNNYINTVQKDKKENLCIIIVSSHKNEEEIIIKSINKIVKEKKLKIFIAPRHIKRIEEVSNMLKKYFYDFTLGALENNNSKIEIIDSFGNLEKYFKKCDIAILGGSFVNKGGHNPLEPAANGCALISGKYVFNWQNIYEDMIKDKACIMINDISELKIKMAELINNESLLDHYKKRALDFSNKKFFDNDALFKEIDLVL